MTETYKHGVYIQELDTKLVPVREVSSSIPVVIGAAPGPADGTAPPLNDPDVCYSYGEFVAAFGESTDYDNYGLCEFADVYFNKYAAAPAIFINVLDATDVTDESKTFASDALTLAHKPVNGTVVVTDSPATSTYVEDTDYSVDYSTGVVTRLTGGAIAAEATVLVDYGWLDPSSVDASAIVGTEVGNVRSGLKMVEDIFPMFGLMPGLVAAPGWSHDSTVGAEMIAQAKNINGVFKCLALLDLPDSVTDPDGVAAQKSSVSFTDPHCVVCWPKVTLGSAEHWLSSHLAGRIAQTDANNDSVPYASPSNKALAIDGLANGIVYSRAQANDLNGAGVVTALNWGGSGWILWGNRTGAYPAETDVKDTFIPIRRMFDWIGNTLVLTFQQKVDFPITRRLINTIVDSANIWLNGLAGREYILGGKVVFVEEENPTTDVMDGIIKFHVYITPPSPAREIDFLLEYDIENLQTLFG